MSTARLWPAGMAAPSREAALRTPARRPVRLIGPELLETRATPDDLMGILSSGVALGGVPLLGGKFVTPIVAMFRGWDNSQTPPAGPPTQPAGGRPRPADEDSETTTPKRPGYAAAYDLRPTAYDSGRTREAESAPAATAGSASDRDPWLSAVGELLDAADSAASRRAGPAPDKQPSNGGGGGGGGSTAANTPAPGSQGATQVPGAGAAAPSLPLSWATDRATSATPSASAAGQAAAGADFAAGGQGQGGTQPASPAEQAAMVAAFGRSQLGFEANVGQADPSVIFQSRGPGFGLWLTKDQMVFGVPRPTRSARRARAPTCSAPPWSARTRTPRPSPSTRWTPAPTTSPAASSPRSTPTSPQYGRVEYQNIYPGVDLSIHSRSRERPDVRVRLRAAARRGPPRPSTCTGTACTGRQLDGQGRLLLRPAAAT